MVATGLWRAEQLQLRDVHSGRHGNGLTILRSFTFEYVMHRTLKVGVLHSPYAQIIVTLCPAGASTAVGNAAANCMQPSPSGRRSHMRQRIVWLQSRAGHSATRLVAAAAAAGLHVWREVTHYIQLGIPIVQPTRYTCSLKLLILVKHSTCFGRSFRPSSGAQNCTYSNRLLSNRCCYLLLAG